MEKINQCYIHKEYMPIVKFENGHNVRECKSCKELSLVKDKRKLKKKIEVSY